MADSAAPAATNGGDANNINNDGSVEVKLGPRPSSVTKKKKKSQV